MNFTHELIIRSIKIVDLGFTVSIYILLGLIVAKLMDKIEGPVNHKKIKEKPFYKILLELILFFWFVGIFWYIARNIVPLIPFPLDGIFGYDHFKLKELHSTTLFLTMLLLISKNYKEKINYLYDLI
jgi:hypothetical protein